jgi:voltage-gated potassium channel
MKDVIICGYGVIGKRVSHALRHHGISYIAVDKKEGVFDDIVYIHGDGTSEDILRKAGIDEAKTIVASTDDDITNAFITLLAKQLNKDITILSSVEDIENIDKLDKAGADYVFSMAKVGRFIARSAIEPFVAEFLDMVNLMEGVEIMPIGISDNSILTNKTIKKAKILRNTGANIIAIRRGKDTIYSPSEEEVIMPNDILLVIGNAEQIRALFNLAEPEKSIEIDQ